jgi:hypothetical protein
VAVCKGDEAKVAPPSQGQGEVTSTVADDPRTDKEQSEIIQKTKSVWVGHSKLQIMATEFNDPTEPLNECEFPVPLGSEVHEWVRELTERKILLLQCVDENVLISAAHEIAKADIFKSWECRALKFGSWKKRPQDPDPAMKDLFDDRMTKRGSRLIVVFGHRRGSEDFLKELPQRDEITDMRKLNESLRIVLLATPKRLLAAGLPVPFDEDYAVPPVDFLPPLLNAKFPQTASQLIHDLRQQFEKHLWGDTDEEFHKTLRSFLRGGQLEAEIENRRQFMEQRDPKAALMLSQSELSRDMLGDDTPLENTVIFVATYFEELPAHDFRRVLLALLGDRTIEVPVARPAPDPSAPPNSTPLALTQSKSLREIWNKEQSAILKKCRLRVLEGNPAVVGFEPADLRKVVKKRFESEFFFVFDELCERVMAACLLFDDKERVSECVVRLLAGGIKNDPSGYGQTFLGAVIFPLCPDLDAHQQGTPERLRTALNRLSDERRYDLLNRLANLLNALVEDQAFAPVEGVLKTFIDLGRHDDALQLLRRIIHPSFLSRRVEILKRIVNEGSAEIRDKVARHLTHWAKKAGSRIVLMLQALHQWSDGSNRPSSAVAAEFFAQFCASCVLPPATWKDQQIAMALSVAEPEAFHEIASWLLSPDGMSSDDREVEESLEWLLNVGLDPEELHYIPALITTFLWIMPRGSGDDDVLFTILSNAALSESILVWWFGSYEQALTAALPGLAPPHIYASTLRATLVADCAIALRGQSSGPQDHKVLDRMAAAVARLERNERITLLAHWAAMASALANCLVIPRSPRFAVQESSAARKQLIERWTAMRTGLIDFRARVLSAVAGPSNMKEKANA